MLSARLSVGRSCELHQPLPGLCPCNVKQPCTRPRPVPFRAATLHSPRVAHKLETSRSARLKATSASSSNADVADMKVDGVAALDWGNDQTSEQVDALCAVVREELAACGKLETKRVHLQGFKEPVYLKVCRDRANWEHETRILEHLQQQGVQATPRLLLPVCLSLSFETKFVLLLEDAGGMLTAAQWTDCQVLDLVLAAVAAMHAAGIVHGDLKPEHFCMKGNEVKIIDFDTATRRTTDYGALLHPDFLSLSKIGRLSLFKYLSEQPNHLFWAAFKGTGEYASWLQHFGYGPSVLGDVESLGYIVMSCMAAVRGTLPWQATALGPGSCSRTMGEAKFILVHVVHDLLSERSPYSRTKAPPGIATAGWTGWWDLLQKHAGTLRTDKEEAAAAALAAFILQELVGCDVALKGYGQVPEATADVLQPPPPTRREQEAKRKEESDMESEQGQQGSRSSKQNKAAHMRSSINELGIEAEKLGRPILEKCLGVPLPSIKDKIYDPLFRSMRAMTLKDEGGTYANFETDLVAAKVQGKNLYNMQLNKRAVVYMHAIQPDVQPQYNYGEWKGMKEEPEVMFVAEFVMSGDTDNIKDRLAQLEVALFCQGMSYPGKVLQRPLVAAVVYAGTDAISFKVDDATLLCLPRCHALALQGRLFGIRMKDSKVLELLNKAQAGHAVVKTTEAVEGLAHMKAQQEAYQLATELALKKQQEAAEQALKKQQEAAEQAMKKQEAWEQEKLMLWAAVLIIFLRLFTPLFSNFFSP